MAKRKVNPYSNLDLTQVKAKLSGNISFLETINLEELNDDIEWVSGINNSMTPTFVATIEQKLDSYVTSIKDSFDQLHEIMRIENKVSDFVSDKLDVLEKLLKGLQEYFDRRPPESIQVRDHYITAKKRKTGEEYFIRKIAANAERQRSHQSKTDKIILSMLPIINDLRENKKEGVSLRRGVSVPHSLLGIYKK